MSGVHQRRLARARRLSRSNNSTTVEDTLDCSLTLFTHMLSSSKRCLYSILLPVEKRVCAFQTSMKLPRKTARLKRLSQRRLLSKARRTCAKWIPLESTSLTSSADTCNREFSIYALGQCLWMTEPPFQRETKVRQPEGLLRFRLHTLSRIRVAVTNCLDSVLVWIRFQLLASSSLSFRHSVTKIGQSRFGSLNSGRFQYRFTKCAHCAQCSN